MKPENVQAAIQALYAYGEAARDDYYALCGKTIQWDLEEIANVLSSSAEYTEEELLSILGIAKTDDGYEWA